MFGKVMSLPDEALEQWWRAHAGPGGSRRRSDGVEARACAGDRRRARPVLPRCTNGCGPYTTLATSPVTREAPYLYVDY